jgi:hypothetical protein
VNEPVGSQIHELTSANYAQPKLTVTPIASYVYMKYAQFIALSTPGLQFTIPLILIGWLWKNINCQRFLGVFLKLLQF